MLVFVKLQTIPDEKQYLEYLESIHTPPIPSIDPSVFLYEQVHLLPI